jgi:hypothetical protein
LGGRQKEILGNLIRNWNGCENGSVRGWSELNIREKTDPDPDPWQRERLWMESWNWQSAGWFIRIWIGSGSVLYTDPGWDVGREGELKNECTGRKRMTYFPCNCSE